MNASTILVVALLQSRTKISKTSKKSLTGQNNKCYQHSGCRPYLTKGQNSIKGKKSPQGHIMNAYDILVAVLPRSRAKRARTCKKALRAKISNAFAILIGDPLR
jgi:hypothetical protein